MHRSLAAGLIALCAAAPVAASPLTFDFTFSGAAYAAAPNAARATGRITFNGDLLANPGRSLYDPGNSLQGSYGTPVAGLVTALSVVVTGAAGGNGVFGLDDFAAVLFDTSGRALNLSAELVGQATGSPSGLTWGLEDPIAGVSPNQNYTGDFQLFARVGSAAPTGIYPFQLGTDAGNDAPLQLLSFAPEAVPAEAPAPTTSLLLGVGLLLLGAVRGPAARAPAGER